MGVRGIVRFRRAAGEILRIVTDLYGCVTVLKQIVLASVLINCLGIDSVDIAELCVEGDDDGFRSAGIIVINIPV